MWRRLENWLHRRRVERAIQSVRDLVASGAPSDEVIGSLKVQGITQSLSVYVMQRAGVGDHAHCKELVIESEHWSDFREATLDLHDAIEDAFSDD